MASLGWGIDRLPTRQFIQESEMNIKRFIPTLPDALFVAKFAEFWLAVALAFLLGVVV